MLTVGRSQALGVFGALIAFVTVTGCSSGDPGEATAPAPPETATEVTTAAEESAPAAEEEQTLPPGATAGLDDLNGDGMPDPTCGTQDYGGGLVIRLLCNLADYASPPTEDTTLVPNSLYGFPSLEVDLTGISGTAIQARDAEGRKLGILFITSDTLFDTGSSDLSEPARANFDAIASLIQSQAPNAPIRVRGHTDATGDEASNQRLSEARAGTVAQYLATRGIDGSLIGSAGLGETAPVVLETNPDGSDNPTGRQYNRRVEIVFTLP
jgi:outer membrane protein OmpA-like peptidoglycan-associated protein